MGDHGGAWIGRLSGLQQRLAEQGKEAERDQGGHGEDRIRPVVVGEVGMGLAFRHIVGDLTADGAEEDSDQSHGNQQRIEDMAGPDCQPAGWRCSGRVVVDLALGDHDGSAGPWRRTSRKWTYIRPAITAGSRNTCAM